MRMSDGRLVPCPFCNRHVRAHERACPHCAGALPETIAPAPARRLPGRLSRSALVAFGAGTAMAAAACGAVDTPFYGAPAVPLEDSGASPPAFSMDASDETGEQDPSDASREDGAPADAGDGEASIDAGDADSEP